MSQVLEVVSILFDVITVVMLLILWRSYRRAEPVVPQLYLFTIVCALLFLGVYTFSMPAGDYVAEARFAGPCVVLGGLWGMASTRGMLLFRVNGHHFLKGSPWMPVWATLNFAGGKLLERFGSGLFGVGGFGLMMAATAATVAANLLLLSHLLRVHRFYAAGPKAGGRLHFCHQCGTGYEPGARRCPVCGEPKATAGTKLAGAA